VNLILLSSVAASAAGQGETNGLVFQGAHGDPLKQRAQVENVRAPASTPETDTVLNSAALRLTRSGTCVQNLEMLTMAGAGVAVLPCDALMAASSFAESSTAPNWLGVLPRSRASCAPRPG
jgi:hypothetical protein